jgi:two-component sensor histidine kinase
MGIANRPTLAALGAAVLIAVIALIFDAMTPQMIAVGIFYVAIVITGFWFPEPKAAFVLALAATPLIIVGRWLTIQDNTPVWAAWTNRILAIGTVWLVAVFVWHIRVLQRKLQRQIDIANGLSREISHRVGNSLQLVASFLRLQAAGTPDDNLRHVLKIAGSRVMVIGRIERTLSHFGSTRAVDSKAFLDALVSDIRSTLPDSEKISVSVQADAAEFATATAVTLGVVLVEFINNALKHAFREGMEGTLTVRFTASKSLHQCVVEVEDDGVGFDQTQMPVGFGIHNTIELARLIDGAITCKSARHSNARPGTIWRLTFPDARLVSFS